MARFHNARPRDQVGARRHCYRYASLAPIVTRHAAAGVRPPRNPPQRRRRDCEMAAILLDKGVPQVAVVGGPASILNAVPHIVPEIASRLVEPQADAMAGGILMAKMKSGAGANPQKPQQRGRPAPRPAPQEAALSAPAGAGHGSSRGSSP